MSNILIVDANEAFAIILKECIQNNLPHKVVISHSVKEAWHAFMEGNFELAIVDLGLDDKNPYELLKAMRLARQELRLIAIPIMGKELPAPVRTLGIQGILSKPFFVDDVKPTIEAALSSEGQKIKTGPITHPTAAEAAREDAELDPFFTDLADTHSSRPATAMNRLSTDELKKLAKAASTDELKRIGKSTTDELARHLNIPATSELLRNAQPPITGETLSIRQEPSKADWEVVEEFSALFEKAEKNTNLKEVASEVTEQAAAPVAEERKIESPPEAEAQQPAQGKGQTGRLGGGRVARGGTGRLRRSQAEEQSSGRPDGLPRHDRPERDAQLPAGREAGLPERPASGRPNPHKAEIPAGGQQESLNQEINRLHREMGAEATMLVAEGRLLACAGALPAERAAQLAELIFRSASISNDISNLLNSHQDECKLFLQENTHSWLYSLMIEPGILLAIVLSPRVTLGFIRSQAKRAQQTISALL